MAGWFVGRQRTTNTMLKQKLWFFSTAAILIARFAWLTHKKETVEAKKSMPKTSGHLSAKRSPVQIIVNFIIQIHILSKTIDNNSNNNNNSQQKKAQKRTYLSTPSCIAEDALLPTHPNTDRSSYIIVAIFLSFFLLYCFFYCLQHKYCASMILFRCVIMGCLGRCVVSAQDGLLFLVDGCGLLAVPRLVRPNDLVRERK